MYWSPINRNGHVKEILRLVRFKDHSKHGESNLPKYGGPNTGLRPFVQYPGNSEGRSSIKLEIVKGDQVVDTSNQLQFRKISKRNYLLRRE